MANIRISDLPLDQAPDDDDYFEMEQYPEGASVKATLSSVVGVGFRTQAHSAILDQTTAPFTTAKDSKLTGIEAGAQVNQSNAEIKAQYEANANTNAFTDGEQSKLAGIEPGAQVNPAASEIKTLYESNADTNAFTDAEKSKLAGIADGAIAVAPFEMTIALCGELQFLADVDRDTDTSIASFWVYPEFLPPPFTGVHFHKMIIATYLPGNTVDTTIRVLQPNVPMDETIVVSAGQYIADRDIDITHTGVSQRYRVMRSQADPVIQGVKLTLLGNYIK